jgi:putative flippase GtrA
MRSLFRFGICGGLATLTHVTVFVLLPARMGQAITFACVTR